MSNYNAQDVRNILTAFAEEFLVDIPARHTDKNEYLLEFTELSTELVLRDDAWYASIAEYANSED